MTRVLPAKGVHGEPHHDDIVVADDDLMQRLARLRKRSSGKRRRVRAECDDPPTGRLPGNTSKPSEASLAIKLR